MRRLRSTGAILVAGCLAGPVLLLAGCGAGPGSAAPSASASSPVLPLASPSPANPDIAAMLLSPKSMPAGWSWLIFDGVDGLPARSCDAGALAAAKVGLQSGAHIVVEDGTLFDTAAHASAFLAREAHDMDCARAATASPAAQDSLGFGRIGDESYSFRSQGQTCDDRILFRMGVTVLELVTPCTETSQAVSTYLRAATAKS
jgi:hypothetical protein